MIDGAWSVMMITDMLLMRLQKHAVEEMKDFAAHLLRWLVLLQHNIRARVCICVWLSTPAAWNMRCKKQRKEVDLDHPELQAAIMQRR